MGNLYLISDIRDKLSTFLAQLDKMKLDNVLYYDTRISWERLHNGLDLLISSISSLAPISLNSIYR